jgi:hypothetical protein
MVPHKSCYLYRHVYAHLVHEHQKFTVLYMNYYL